MILMATLKVLILQEPYSVHDLENLLKIFNDIHKDYMEVRLERILEVKEAEKI